MGYLSKEEILAADDIAREEVEVPEWGGTVLVRGLTAKEYISLGTDMQVGEGTTVDREKAKDLMPLVVSMGVIDEDGNSVFEEEDVEALAKKSFAPINRITSKILNLSNVSLGEEGEEVPN